jgi:citrate synthase
MSEPKKAKLILDGQEIELPVIIGSEGEKGIDVTQLRAQTGYITMDPGLANSGSCTSSITYIDGEKGILRYRGIPIEQFGDVPHPNFVEVAWLLIFGRLPKKEEYSRFSEMLTNNANLNEDMKHHFQGFPTSAPPMAILSAMINTLACFHTQYLQLGDVGIFEEAAAKLLSKIRTIAAYSYRSTKGLPYMYPNPKLRYAANFLHMMFSLPYDEYKVDPDIEDALNLFLILHADHEQNCSTTTVRMVGSSKANLFTSCAAGVCALWGPLHGGANVAVMEMLDRIHQGNLTPDEYLRRAKDKNSDVRLMGFGHRVYKNFDPRAKILKKACDKVLDKLGRQDPLLDIARRLEELALNDPYFVDRKLYPNVDFYSGILLRAIGIPTSMFTVMFAMGRLPGWIAQWKEQHDESNGKIARPRQIYVGPTINDYISMKNRE